MVRHCEVMYVGKGKQMAGKGCWNREMMFGVQGVVVTVQRVLGMWLV